MVSWKAFKEGVMDVVNGQMPINRDKLVARSAQNVRPMLERTKVNKPGIESSKLQKAVIGFWEDGDNQNLKRSGLFDDIFFVSTTPEQFRHLVGVRLRREKGSLEDLKLLDSLKCESESETYDPYKHLSREDRI